MQLESPADLRRRFGTGRPCLDLVHTGGEGALARFELVDDPGDLGRLLGVILGLPPVEASDAALAEMRRVPAAAPPLVPALRAGGGTTIVAPTAAAALSTIARDAVDLFGGPLARLIRVC